MPVTAQLAERRVEKSPLAFRTISEVAADLEVPQHVLRFWETKFPQIRPLKRGGGRRYYRPEDVDLLRRVRALLYDEGYTIKGVQRLLRERARNSEPLPATPRPAVPAVAAGEAPPADRDQTRSQLESVLADLEHALETLRDRVRDS